MILDKQDLQQPRSAADFFDWVEAKIQSYVASGRTEWENRYFKRGPAKILVDELRPLGLFAKHHFKSSRDIFIEPLIGSQNYDATVVYKPKGKGPIAHIEITQASEGENEYWRKVVLRQEGQVNPVGEVIKSKQGVTVKENRRLRSSEFFRSQELQFISEAAIKKATKPYPPKTALIIQFSDSPRVIRDEADLAFLESNFRKDTLPKVSKFTLVALVGESGQHYLEF